MPPSSSAPPGGRSGTRTASASSPVTSRSARRPAGSSRSPAGPSSSRTDGSCTSRPTWRWTGRGTSGSSPGTRSPARFPWTRSRMLAGRRSEARGTSGTRSSSRPRMGSSSSSFRRGPSGSCRTRTSRRRSPYSRDVVRPATEAAEHFLGGLVARMRFQRLLEMLPREMGLPPKHVHPGQVCGGAEVAAVPLGLEGLLEPRDCLLRSLKLDEVRSDVVVRISERWVRLDRPLALLDRALGVPHEAVRPAEERVALRGRKQREGPLVQVHSILQVAEALEDVGGVERPPRGEVYGRQVVSPRVQRTARERLVDALLEVGVVMAHDPALRLVREGAVAGEEAGPRRP